VTRSWRVALLAVAVVALLAVAAALAVRAIDPAGRGSVDAAPVAPVSFDHLPVRVERAAGEAGGCPAHAYRAPAEPMVAPQPDADGSTGGSSGTYAVGDGSHLLVQCLGASSEHPPLEDWGEDRPSSDDGFEVVSLTFEERAGLGLVVRQALGLGGEVLVTDWVFERDGWLFAVGHLKAQGGPGPAEALLSSWTWG
jgi:hypothetical protein